MNGLIYLSRGGLIYLSDIAVSSDDIAGATGLSRKCANKFTKRLTAAGLIQPGEPQAKKRTFDVSGWEQMEPKQVTGGSVEESLKTLAEKVDRLQTMIGSLTGALEAVTSHDVQNMTGIMPVCVQVKEQKNTQAGMIPASGQKETGLNPAHIPDDQNMTQTATIQATMDHNGIPDGIEQDTNMTGTVTFQAIEETAVDIQTGMMPQSDTERTKAISEAIKGTVNDSIVSDLDNAILRVRARQAALASFNQEKQKQSSFSDTCSPARRIRSGICLVSMCRSGALTWPQWRRWCAGRRQGSWIM